MIGSADDLGRPSIDRSLVVWHKTSRTSSRILIGNVRTGRVSTVRASRRMLVSNPSLRGGVIDVDRAVPRRLPRAASDGSAPATGPGRG